MGRKYPLGNKQKLTQQSNRLIMSQYPHWHQILIADNGNQENSGSRCQRKYGIQQVQVHKCKLTQLIINLDIPQLVLHQRGSIPLCYIFPQFFALIYYSTGYLELPTAQIKDYKNQSKEEVLIDDVLLDKFLPPNSITPIIFTRKLPQGGQYRQKANQPTWVGAFENLLTVVVQLYYKSDQKIAEFMKDKIPMDSRKELKQDKRPGRKKKAIQNQEAENMNSEFLEPQQNGVTTIYGQLQQDVLEILISPLRSDFPFEQWTLKEIAIFECAICRYGKQYEFLAQILRNKTAQDILQFYYFWKFTSHYKLWKLNKAYYHRSNLNNFV